MRISPSKPNTELSFAEFMARHQNPADALANCPRPDWILRTLNDHGYCNCENLEGFIDSLSTWIDDTNDEAREQARREYFNYQSRVNHLEQKMVTGNLSRFEARRCRLISAWNTALEAVRYVFEDKVGGFQFNNLFAKIMSE